MVNPSLLEVDNVLLQPHTGTGTRDCEQILPELILLQFMAAQQHCLRVVAFRADMVVCAKSIETNLGNGIIGFYLIHRVPSVQLRYRKRRAT